VLKQRVTLPTLCNEKTVAPLGVICNPLFPQQHMWGSPIQQETSAKSEGYPPHPSGSTVFSLYRVGNVDES